MAGIVVPGHAKSARRTVHTKKPLLSAGLGHSAIVLEQGELVTFGLARQYQLGLDFIKEKDRRTKSEADLPDPVDRHSPQVVPALRHINDKVATVACGSSHTLAVGGSGHVYSWGSGAFGKLGHGETDGEYSDVRIPRQVEFKRKRIARVSCGPDHSAAVSEGGEVLTWGAGSYGNLGHGDNNDEVRPRLVETLLGKACISVACGSKHTLALTAAGAVFAWGYGGGGRLGCGDTRGLFRPKLVDALKDHPCHFISAGESHSMSLLGERGQCYSWGVGDYGKLGHGDTTPQNLPRHLEYFRQYTLTWVAGGTFHSAGTTDQGLLFTWGGGTYGKLGQQDTMNSLTPRPCKSLQAGAHFVQVDCGVFHTMAVTKLGDVYTFGFNGNGRLGLAGPGTTDTRQRNVPHHLKNLLAAKDTDDIGMPLDESQAATTALVKALRPKKVSHLCLGGFYSAALTDQGDLYTWGDGRHGATGLDLSRSEEKEVKRPSRVLGLGGARNSVAVLAAGVRHLIAVTHEGSIFSWGDGSLGRLGHGDTTAVGEPRVISTLKAQKIVRASAGEEHSAAVGADGTLYTWGSGSFGKLGHGEPSDELTPRKVNLDLLPGTSRRVSQVACGFAHSVALCDSFEVLVWGSGFKGKLGLGDDQNRLTPTSVPVLKRKKVAHIACGSFHTVVATETGDVYTWGIGERGQLGHGDLENHKTPDQVLGLQGVEVTVVAAGEAHTMAVSRDGSKTWAWGAGHYGQLGVGGLEPRLSPASILELESQQIRHVACGSNHSGAVSDTGKVYMWGNGANSRLGNGMVDEQKMPQLVPALASSALTDSSSASNDEPSRLLTPEMMRKLHGTDIDAATAQKVLDDSTSLATRAQQADAEAARREEQAAAGGLSGADSANLREELANTEKDDASVISTVMAVAMAGRAIRPQLDKLQQLVKSQRENVAEIIENEQRQIDSLKGQLDEMVHENETLEAECLTMESKVDLVLSNHKMVHESLTKHYGYTRIELLPGLKASSFEKGLYERMISILYEEPQYLSVMLRKAEADQVDRLVQVICERIYANHYKARDEYYILALITHAMGEDMSNVTRPTDMLAQVNYVTKLMSAYTRRGPNTEALKDALFKPLSLVLARKKLDLEIDPARVYAANLEWLRHKGYTELPSQETAARAWKIKEVQDIVKPRIKQLLDIAELFLTRVISARGVLPYGVRAIAQKVYEMAQDRFPKATDIAKMAGVANFLFTSYLCPAIIQPEAFDLCSISSRPTAAMKRNLLRIAATLKAFGSLKAYDDLAEPWMAEISSKISGSAELMRQCYSNLTDVPELEDQRRVTMYMESTEPRTPTRAFELNAIYLLHSVLYRNHTDIVSSSDAPLTTILRDLGNMPDQLPADQNKQVLLRLQLRSRDELLASKASGSNDATPVDLQADLRQSLLDCLRIAPTVNLRQNEGLTESMEELLRECKADARFEAAAGVQKVLELLKRTGVADGSNGEAFLQQTADEISKRARRRVRLVKERTDLQKIVDFVITHKVELRRKHAAYNEYLDAVREQRVTVKNVYTNEKLQRGDRRKARKDDAAAKREEEERKKADLERVRVVMSSHPTFAHIIEHDPVLLKYVEAHPNLTKTQMRDLLDRRPDFVAAFDKNPEELMKIGRAPSLTLMLNQHKELKAALDKKQEVREILESKPDLTRNQLNELVHTNAQLKDLYDSRPELKELLQQRAKLFEDEQKALEDQKADSFVAGPLVKVSAKYLTKDGVIVTLNLPPKMVQKLTFEFSSVRPGTTSVLAMHNGRAVFAFELRLEDLLNMQHHRQFVLDQGKLKLDVGKTLTFLNERMRF